MALERDLRLFVQGRNNLIAAAVRLRRPNIAMKNRKQRAVTLEFLRIHRISDKAWTVESLAR